MATNLVKTELPKVIGVGAIADDAVLATGLLTLEDGGAGVITIKVSDIINWSTDAYTAGTAEIATIDLTGATLIANNTYSIAVRLPNVINFFGGGGHATADARESRAIYVTRTYTVSTLAAPVLASFEEDIALALGNAISADLYAAFTVNSVVGAVITIEACDATAGSFEINISNMAGTVVIATTPNVLPVGEPLEVQRYVLPSQVTAASYDRHYVRYRKYIRHNAVKGLECVKEEVLIVYSDTADALPATLDPILDGTYLPVADYLGAPVV
jgi:3D (Asp-Asp-Asp) domain-containing protein